MNYKIENGIAGPIITFNDYLKQETYFDIPSNILNVIKGLEQENQQLKQQLEQRDNIINKAKEFIKTHQRKDEFLDLNEWQTRDLLEILNIDKGE